MPEIHSAADYSTAQLLDVTNDAFSDYAVPMRQTLQGFETFLRQRGVVLPRSFVMVEGNEIVALWLISVRGKRGYLASSGTRPAFRGRGIARALAEHSMADLVAKGVNHLQTEVLQSNTAAFALYQSLGMVIRRQLNCFTIPETPLVETGLAAFVPVQWSDIAPDAAALHDWPPSWQNAAGSLVAAGDNLMCLAHYDAGRLVAYAAVYRDTATLAQFAVAPDHRRQGLGRAIIGTVQRALPDRALRVINAQEDDLGFDTFMQALNAEPIVQQFELCREL